MAMIRAFFALPLSAAAEQQLAACADQLRNRLDSFADDTVLRWVKPQNYHLTLSFLGDIAPSSLEKLDTVAEQLAAAQRADDLTVSTFAWFPSTVKPKLLAAMPDKHPGLEQLQRELRAQLRRQGFHVEGKPFRPHITLARIKNGRPGTDAMALIAEQEALCLRMPMDELVLFSSKLTPDGPIYTPMLVKEMV